MNLLKKLRHVFKKPDMKKINVEEFNEWRKNNKEHQLIDVRERHEYDTGNIGGLLIPLGELMSRMEEVNADIPVVMQCRSGRRSAVAAELLKSRFPDIEVYNLEGGILDWIEKIDSNIQS
jgi:rhodanese-related sulfurtransferase